MAPNPSGHRCPICRQPVDAAAPEFPFCGIRCRTTDLGNWAAEKYRVSVPISDPAELDDALPPPGDD